MEKLPALPERVLEAADVTATDTGLVFNAPQNLSWESYENLGRELARIGRAYPWMVGDLVNAGHDVFGEEFSQIEDVLPHSPQTIANYSSVARYIPRDRRRKTLSFSVHEAVAYLEPRAREKLLDMAERYDWKRDDMREAKRELLSKLGSVADTGVTGKSERLGQAGLAREEHPATDLSLGVPAIHRVGEPVPSPNVCPHCGRPYEEET